MQEIVEQILEHYGRDTQRLKAVEEMAELTQAILKEDRENILEELADVKIMLMSMIKVYNLSEEEIEAVMQKKLNRQLGRMERGEK